MELSLLVFMVLFTAALEPAFFKGGVARLRRWGRPAQAEQERQGTLIVGAGPTARTLGRILARTQPVRMVDRNQKPCRLAEADGLQVVQGNALDERILSEAGAAQVRHFIALTPNAEVNTLTAQLAKTLFLVPEVHILNSGDEAGHAVLVDHLHASTLFGGPVTLGDWDYRIDHDQAERTGLPVQNATAPAALFRALQEHQPCLPLAVRRGSQYLPFHSGCVLQQKDRVILLQDTTSPYDTLDRFDRLVAKCPILDLDRSLSMHAFFETVTAALAPRLEMDSAHLTRLLLSREVASSTVLLPGLAIPHVLIEGTGQFELLVARCRDGIPFPEQPEHVHTVFVMVSTQDERNFHLRALSAVAQIAQAPDFDARWLMAGDAEALRKLILNGKRRRFPEPPKALGRRPEQIPS